MPDDSEWSFEPGAVAPGSPTDDLLRRARALEAGASLRGLYGLIGRDAARWHAWPGDCHEAVQRERALLEELGHTASGGVLAKSLAVRQAALAAKGDAGFDAAAEAIAALPAGYPVKSTWLHWRDLLLRTGHRERWNPTRRRLAQELQRRGVPPSETLPALLGRLDLARWRQERRLMAAAAEHLAAVYEAAGATLATDTARRTFAAATGRYLLALGEEGRGAELIHGAGDDLPVVVPPGPARLFSRPSPEAAVWLRRSIERTSLLQDECRDVILRHAVAALFSLAARYRQPHLLSEGLSPLPVRFDRDDVTALVLAEGALAWLACGDRWQGREWLGSGLRVLSRHTRDPLAPEAALLALAWADRTGDVTVFETVRDVSRRTDGPRGLEVAAMVARWLGRHGHEEQAWEQLASTYRQARAVHPAGQPGPVVRCAEVLLSWQRTALGLSLLRKAIEPGPAGQLQPLPGNLSAGTADLATERHALITALDQGRCPEPATSAACGALLRSGLTRLAAKAAEAAWRAVELPVEPDARLRAALSLARTVAEGADLELAREVERAAESEMVGILERLRVDDPPLDAVRR